MRHEPTDAQATLVVFVTSLVAYGHHAFGTGLVADNWRVVSDPWWMHEWFLMIHRWGVLPIWAVAQWGVVAPAVTLSACVLMLIAGVHRAAPAVGLDTPLARACASLLLVLSPMTGVHLAYRQNNLPTGVAFLLCVEAMLALHTAALPHEERGGARWVGLRLGMGFLALVWATGIHQVSLLVFLTLVLFGVGARLREDGWGGGALRLGGASVACVGAWIVSEAIAVRALAWFGYEPLGENGPYATRLIETMAELDTTTRRLGHLVYELVLRPQHLIPGSVKVAVLLLAVGVGVGWVRAAWPRRNALIAPLLVGVSFVLPFVVAWVRLPENSYRYTALFTVSVVYGLFGGVAVARSTGWVRTASLALVGWIGFQLALSANASGLMMQLNTELELRTTQGVLHRVAALAGERGPRAILLLGPQQLDGPPWELPGGDGLMQDSTTQLRVHADRAVHLRHLVRIVEPGLSDAVRYEMLEEPDGWRRPVRQSIRRRGMQERFLRARRWPHPDSVVWDAGERTAFVVMSERAEEDVRRMARAHQR